MENNLNDFKFVKQLNSGASLVEKYIITKDNKNYLLRLYNPNFMISRIKAFNNISLLRENSIKVPKVYQYGFLPDRTKGYAILDWIDGQSLNCMFDNDEQQIKYGKLVALELKKMHDASKGISFDIYEKYITSLEKKYQKVLELGLSLEKIKFLHSYALEKSSILKKEQQTSIIHGDFHPGNIVVDDANTIWFIDMDVCKRANKLEEFSSNACNMDYPMFYSSVIHNYFNYNVPENFWEIYDLYGCLYVLDHFLYLSRIKNRTVDEGIEVLNNFLDYFNNFSNNEPTWFNKDIKERKKVMV